MRVRVLGTLELSGDGAAGVLGGEKLRTLLAALIVRRGGVVSIDQLVEELWPRRAPATAVNLVHQHVARLRRAFGADGAGLLCARRPGYQLVLPEGALDAQEFERLAATGMSRLRQHDHQAAATELTQALDLWRGAAFCDVPASAAVEAEASRLEQLRLEALEARIEAELTLGRHAVLAAELQALTEEHALREGFWRQLMLTLYRCGRQAEALEAYRRLYQHLSEALGIEPTQELRDLHQQILAGDPALQPAAATQVTATTPRQLPAATPGFVGRTDELARLDALAAAHDGEPANVVIAAIAGTAGVGKTALAVHWAHQIAGRFPDGQLYVNLRGFDPSGQVMAPGEAVRGFLDAFGVAPERIPTDLDAQVALYRSLVSTKRVLVVLDNAHDSDQIRPLLPGSPGCLVVATSRDDLTGLVAKEGARPLTLDLLTTAEAGQLLTHRLGQARVIGEPSAVEHIVEACARLPLALAIVAARAATHPRFSLQALAAELRDTWTRLDALGGADKRTDVRAVFSWSYQRLSPEARRSFRLLGLHSGQDISAPAAASLAGVPVREVRPLLAELTRRHLVDEHAPGRYTFHDLLRAYARELARAHDDEAEERHAATHRALDHYLHTAHAAARLLNPLRDPISLAPAQPGVTAERLADRGQAMAWFTAEHHVLLATIEQAAGAGFDTHAWQLAWALDGFLDHRCHWHDRTVARMAGLEAALRLGDPFAQADSHRGLAGAYIRLRRMDDAEAHLRLALELYAECGDRAGQAHTHRNLCWVYEQRGDYTKALAHDEQALALHGTIRHPVGRANALNSIGWLHAHLGNHELALTYSQNALVLFRELHDRDGQAAAWNSLGYAHHQLGHHRHATACYQRAVNLYRDLGNRYDQANTLTELGDTQNTAGDRPAARQAWRQALSILEQHRHPDAEDVQAKLDQLEADSARLAAWAQSSAR